MEGDHLLIVADSEHDANMLFATGMFVPDSFIFLRLHDKNYVVMNDLEIDRARKQAKDCQVISLSDCHKKLLRAGETAKGFAPIIRLLLKQKGVRKILVPANFPLELADELRAAKIGVEVREGGIFPEREIKTSDEVRKISAALLMAEVGLAEGIQALKLAKVDANRTLIYRGVPLTSEKLRAIIDVAITQVGGNASHTIVAGGRQGCDPHERGYGVLRAHEPIILDVFPRSQKTGYFGDITRTVVKGKPSEAVRKLHATVAHAQEIAFSMIRSEAQGQKIHEAIQTYFESEGFKTGKRNGRMEGFFHGTGHGLGLDIHEFPRISVSVEHILKAGHVVTVEPGLYYPNLGGVRLEDVAHVTGRGMRNLTKFEKTLEV